MHCPESVEKHSGQSPPVDDQLASANGASDHESGVAENGASDAEAMSDPTQCIADLESFKSLTYPHAAELLVATGKDIPTDAGNYRMCTEPPVGNVASYFLAKGSL